MTKRELLENEDFKNASMDSVIMLPNWHYGLEGDEVEYKPLSEVKYWDFKEQIDIL